MSKWNREQQQIFRQFVLDAERLEMDANGRVLIPKRYLQMVSIDTDVRFLGVDNTIELWAKGLEKPLVEPYEFSSKLEELMGSSLSGCHYGDIVLFIYLHPKMENNNIFRKFITHSTA